MRLPRVLDHRRARSGAALVGRHDFTTFRHIECQAKSPVKTLDRSMVARRRRVARHGSARSFLHTQVRLDGGRARGGRGWTVERGRSAQRWRA